MYLCIPEKGIESERPGQETGCNEGSYVPRKSHRHNLTRVIAAGGGGEDWTFPTAIFAISA